MTDRYKPPSQKVSTPVILVDPTTGEVYTAIPVAIDDAGTLATEATLTDVNSNIFVVRGAVKLEDAVVGAGDAGIPAMVVRDDSLAALTNADGDYTHLRVGSTGLLWTTVSGILPGTAATQLGKAEDAAHTSGDVGVYTLAVRADTAAASGANGDYVSFIVDANGRQWVTALIDTALPAGTNLIGDVGIRPGTTNGLSTFMASGSDGSTALTSTAQVVKGSAGKVYGYYIYNPNSSATFVHFYNVAAASVTVGTTSPLFTLTIPAGGAANLMNDIGITFGTAISVSATSTAGGNGAPATALDLVAWYA